MAGPGRRGQRTLLAHPVHAADPYADFNARIAERPEQLRLLHDAAAAARDLARLDPRRYRPVLRQALRKLARELVYLVPTREQASEARALRREARGLTLAVWRDRLRPW